MKKIFFILSVLLSFTVLSQNLILNGDFEDIIECPKGVHPSSKVLKNVTNPNEGSFDFIHTCNPTDYFGVSFGGKSPQSRDGYTGICVFISSSYSTRSEYLQLQIKDSLIIGKIYHFEMYLNLSTKSHIAINKLGVFFSNTLVQQKTDNTCRFKPDIISYDYYENREDWGKFSGDYIAKGGERYLIIGNFYLRKYINTKVIDVGKPINDNDVYYFIDNVSLTENKNLANGIVLNNVNFKSGSKDLMESSFRELDKIVSVLIANSTYNIEIIGHTDKEGNDSDNLKLSQDRAQTVAAYLIEKGIDKLRITSSGKGSQQPIGDNEAEEGRLKNRRVEFKFTAS